ncbi:MAG: hypothetical protein ACK5FT_02725 [Sphingomonadales bacterium]|jgi:hypothetical protein
MKLKFNNIRDLADARYAAAAMADFIGFRIGSDDELSASAIQEIIGWCAGPAVILEISDQVDTAKINALLNTLPVNGIETSEHRFTELKEAIATPDLIWIVNTQNAGEWLSHSEFLINQNNLISKIEPSAEIAESVVKTEPWGISIDCFESVSTGIKDFSDWNDFFEALEIL